jgi:putative transposase
MYDYRKMTPAQRHEAVEYRRLRMRPWHSPPHWEFEGLLQFMISSACYEHKRIIGVRPERLTECENEILDLCDRLATKLYAWCVLPNHYHVLIQTDHLKEFRMELGRFHGRTSFKWNGEDNSRGRHVWHNCLDRVIRSPRHFWATVNYIHHNPVHHGYVGKWQDWPWSSAEDFIKRVGRDTATRIWSQYPVLDYGKTWDVDEKPD